MKWLMVVVVLCVVHCAYARFVALLVLHGRARKYMGGNWIYRPVQPSHHTTWYVQQHYEGCSLLLTWHLGTVPLIRENGWTTLGTRRLQLTLTAKPIIGATWILNLSQPDHISNNKQVISSTYTGNNRTAPTIVTADLSGGYIPGTYLLTVDL